MLGERTITIDVSKRATRGGMMKDDILRMTRDPNLLPQQTTLRVTTTSRTVLVTGTAKVSKANK